MLGPLSEVRNWRLEYWLKQSLGSAIQTILEFYNNHCVKRAVSFV